MTFVGGLMQLKKKKTVIKTTTKKSLKKTPICKQQEYIYKHCLDCYGSK